MDRRLKVLQRLAQEGDLNAAAQILRERIRSGELSYRNVQLAAYLDHPVASYLNLSPITLKTVPFNYSNSEIGPNAVDNVIATLSDKDFVVISEDFIHHVWENVHPITRLNDTAFGLEIDKTFVLIKKLLNNLDEEFAFWEELYSSEDYRLWGREAALELGFGAILKTIEIEKDLLYSSYRIRILRL